MAVFLYSLLGYTGENLWFFSNLFRDFYIFVEKSWLVFFWNMLCFLEQWLCSMTLAYVRLIIMLADLLGKTCNNTVMCTQCTQYFCFLHASTQWLTFGLFIVNFDIHWNGRHFAMLPCLTSLWNNVWFAPRPILCLLFCGNCMVDFTSNAANIVYATINKLDF